MVRGRGGAKGGFREQVTTLGLAILIALSVRHFVIEPFRIPSGSMFPTLLIGDHLFVNKFIYGAKIPFTDYRLPSIRDPERGDVVVFTVAKRGHSTYPADRKPRLPKEEFVKRIIGVPGDEIDFRAGKIHVNGEAIDQTSLDEPFVDPAGTKLDQAAISMGDHDFVVLDDPRRMGPSARWPIRVEPGRYFMWATTATTRRTVASGERCASKKSAGLRSSCTSPGTSTVAGWRSSTR